METFFLVCFLFGALFTAVSLASGVAGMHLPHLHLDGGHAGNGAGHGASAPHVGDPGHDLFLSPLLAVLNLSSLLAFLTWFGAAGFLALRFGGWPVVLAVGVGVAVGVVGAVAVALFLQTVMRGERIMNPHDYRLDGTLARVTVTIPAGGTGEIVFSKAGGRRSEAARGANGAAVARGVEVVVIEYMRGTAVVEPWEQFIAAARSGPVPDEARR